MLISPAAGSAHSPMCTAMRVCPCCCTERMKETSTHPHPPVQGEVGSRFEYKSGNCVLWTRDGACVDDIALIRDDDRLFATDNTPFPQLLRELRTPGLRNVPLTAANGMPPSQQFQTWGWPRIGQLVGAETVRSKLLTGWLHTSAEASVLLLINMVAFLSPPTEVASEPPMPVLRMHFWFAGLGMVAALFALVLAVLLSMQLNLLPHEADVFWFLRAYGSWLFGWPTVCVCTRAPVFMHCFHMCLAPWWLLSWCVRLSTYHSSRIIHNGRARRRRSFSSCRWSARARSLFRAPHSRILPRTCPQTSGVFFHSSASAPQWGHTCFY